MTKLTFQCSLCSPESLKAYIHIVDPEFHRAACLEISLNLGLALKLFLYFERAEPIYNEQVKLL